MTLSHQLVGFGAAFQVEEFKISGNQLHGQQSLAGSFKVEAARNDRRHRDNLRTIPEQGDQAILRFAFNGGCIPQVDRAIFSLDDAGFNQILECFQGSGARLGVAFILTDVCHRFERKLLLPRAFEYEPCRFGTGDGDRHRCQQIIKKRRHVRPAVQQALHEARAFTGPWALLFLALL